MTIVFAVLFMKKIGYVLQKKSLPYIAGMYTLSDLSRSGSIIHNIPTAVIHPIATAAIVRFFPFLLNVTYSQYARGGFWELLFVGIINFVMVLLCMYLFSENINNHILLPSRPYH